MRRMRIKIGKDGTTNVAVEGEEGPGCVEFTRLMEQALGSVEKRDFKDEYHHEVVVEAMQENLLDRGGL